MKNQLNNEQIKIINSHGDIFVKAGAGTGKTRTITELYIDLLINREYDVRNILAITFTEKAANEMKERIKQTIRTITQEAGEHQKSHLLTLQKRMNYAWISTLHSFCSRILREFPLQSGVDPLFEIIDEVEKKSLIKYTVRNYFNQSDGSKRFNSIKDLAYLYRYDNLLTLFEEALEKKQYELSRLQVSSFQTRTDDIEIGQMIQSLLPDFQKVFNEMVSDYRQHTKKENKLDYDGLLFETINLLKQENGVREKLQSRFRCIIVDEFQDTNQQQKEIVGLLAHDDNKVVFVGDPKQSIYYFNGADVSVFNQTEKEFKNQEIFALFRNYRSNSELIDFFNFAFPRIFVNKQGISYTVAYEGLSAEASRFSKQPVKLLPIAQSFEEECENICRYIQLRASKDTPYRDFAILMRRMTKVETLENALKRSKIPYYVNGSRGFFSKPEIMTLVSMVKAIYDPTNEENLLLLLRSYLSPYSDSDLVDLRLLDKGSLLKAWELYSDRQAVSTNFYQQFLELKKRSNLISPSKLVREIVDLFDYEFVISQLTNPTRRLLNLKKFLELTQLFEGEISIRRFLNRIEGMAQSNEGEASIDSEKNNVVKIMTIHKSKGLEFPIVIVPELGYLNHSGQSKPKLLVDYETGQISLKDPVDDEQSGSDYTRMLLKEKAKEYEEEKRVLYVAFTRAQNELVLSYSPPKNNKKNAPFRNALINFDILKENGKEEAWTCDSESEVICYLETVKHSMLYADKNQSELSLSNNELVESNIHFEFNIPSTVYPLIELEWKKYVSPTLLTQASRESKQTYEQIGIDEDMNEKKNENRMTLGSMVHRVLEDLGDVPLRSINLERIKAKLSDEPTLKEHIPEIKRIIQRMQSLKSPLIDEIEQSERIYSELPLRKKFGQYVLTGTVDKLFFINNEWKIVDFKYSIGSQKDDKDYLFQIRFYLYCLQTLVDPSPCQGYIYYIKSNKVTNVYQVPDIQQQILEKIKAFEKKNRL